MNLLLNFILWVFVLKTQLFAFDIDLKKANADIMKEYELLKKKYDESEKVVREQALLQSITMVKSHNARFEAGKETYQLGLNKFSDWTEQEFSQVLGYKSTSYKGPLDVFGPVVNIFLSAASTITAITGFPSYPKVEDDGKSFDYRTHPCNGKVLDQKKCGSCYAFSSLQVLNFNKCAKCENSEPRDSSVQNIVDCSDDQGNKGCNGGLMKNVFDYIKGRGVDPEHTYSYKAVKGECKFDAAAAEHKDVDGYTELTQKDENEMMKAVADTKELCVAVRVTKKFQQYKSGVFDDETSCRAYGFQLNHAVGIVGYGKDAETGKLYWLVRNSWGEGWGEKGYIRIVRGCCCAGICLKPGYPTFACGKQQDVPAYLTNLTLY